MFSLHRMTLATALAVLVSASTSAQDFTGADSTFVFPVMSRWSAECGAKSDTKVTYQSAS